MEETPVASLAIHFADLDDPREASGRHRFSWRKQRIRNSEQEVDNNDSKSRQPSGSLRKCQTEHGGRIGVFIELAQFPTLKAAKWLADQ